ncbi:hypothetical protein MJD09_23105 [bacterium]|nr:hypothetical protein [bacterium]
MNIYVIVEGKTATKKIYKNWIPRINNSLSHVDYIENIERNNFFILAVFGQPEILARIERAVRDVNDKAQFDRLVIAIDSENDEPLEKQREVRERVDRVGSRVEVKYVIQHFCLETWLLGNKNMFRKKTSDSELIKYMALFNVRANDPEQLPDNEEQSWNRSQFAFHYLRAGIRDVYSGRKSYTKRNPGIVATVDYFNQVKKRCLHEGHILSFRGFLDAFV